MISIKLFASILIISLIIIRRLEKTNAILVFVGQTTACDTCDGIETNSVRNIVCCAKFSKCCIPDSIDKYNDAVASSKKKTVRRVSSNRRARTRKRNPTKPIQ